MQLSGDKIRFDSELMQGLFTNSVATTVSHVKSILRDSKARGTKAILMVGGFSESLMLQDAIKKEFSNLKIIIPKEASSAILRGKVIFGHDPTSISRRVLKKTYGIETNSDFKEGLHDRKYRTHTAVGIKCEKAFDRHVEKGQSVKVGEAQTEKQYYPIAHHQENFDFLIFSSDIKDPKYTDQGCQYIGKLFVDISDVPGDLNRCVWVSLTFSDTEIKAEARVEATNEKVSVTFDFLG